GNLLGYRSARTVSRVPSAEASQKWHGRSQSAKSGLGHQREAVRSIGAGERRDEPIIVKRCHVNRRACTGCDQGCHRGGPEITKKPTLLGFHAQVWDPAPLSVNPAAPACYQSSTTDCVRGGRTRGVYNGPCLKFRRGVSRHGR